MRAPRIPPVTDPITPGLPEPPAAPPPSQTPLPPSLLPPSLLLPPSVAVDPSGEVILETTETIGLVTMDAEMVRKALARLEQDRSADGL